MRRKHGPAMALPAIGSPISGGKKQGAKQLLIDVAIVGVGIFGAVKTQGQAGLPAMLLSGSLLAVIVKRHRKNPAFIRQVVGTWSLVFFFAISAAHADLTKGITSNTSAVTSQASSVMSGGVLDVVERVVELATGPFTEKLDQIGGGGG